VLQCVASCCSVLHHVASVSREVVMCCSVLHHVAVCCVCVKGGSHVLQCVLYHVAVCCSGLQWVSVCCSCCSASQCIVVRYVA